MMSSKGAESMRTMMESFRLTCNTEIPVHQRSINVCTDSFRKSVEAFRARAQEIAQYQVKLEEIKGKLREADNDWVKALAVKSRKEAKRMALMDTIVSTGAKVEDLQNSLEEQRTKRDQYAATIFQQSLALETFEGKTNVRIEHINETLEAISWYNMVLGFHVEGGYGAKFTFKNINLNNSNEEYFFTIRHENNTYILLNCEPSLKTPKS